jgi:hypothetical protein
VVLGDDTKVVLLLAAAMFLLALLLGVWKFRQMEPSEEGLAHPYVDTAHRAALLYSFSGLNAFMIALIVTEIGGWLVLVAGFIDAQVL